MSESVKGYSHSGVPETDKCEENIMKRYVIEMMINGAVLYNIF
jgi:hypothetical protein